MLATVSEWLERALLSAPFAARVHTQRRVLETALTMLSGASASGARLDFDIAWPVEACEAYRAWQPEEPSPIIAQMLHK